MPSDDRPGRKGVYVELPLDLLEAVRRLAERNGRGFRDEVQHALERHLEAPPTVRIVIDTPALAATEVPQASQAVEYGAESDAVAPRRPHSKRKKPGKDKV